MNKWIPAQMPSQNGRMAVITGATSGIGLETATALAGAGAIVLLTGRNQVKGNEALARIKSQYPAADVSFETADLSSLTEVAALAERVSARFPALDLLINNAGVMAIPKRCTTADGFEMQFGTNYLGHFALTARLLPNLRRAKAPRVVVVSSLANALGTMNFDDLQSEHGYRPYKAYSQSKLAALIFAFELQRRSEANGWNVLSVAAHPGWSSTNLQTSGPRTGRTGASFSERLTKLLAPLFAQSAARGALPTLFSATMPVSPASYYGPDGWREMKGFPVMSKILSPEARNPDIGNRLWTVSERLADVSTQ